MKENAVLFTIIATVFAAGSFVLVSYLQGRPVEWLSAIVFIVVFSLVFNISRKLFKRKGK